MNTRHDRYPEYDKLLVGEKIKKLRGKETQKQFVDKLYHAGITGRESDSIMSIETLKSWELGRTSEISISNLMKICNATGCDLDYLLTDQKMKTKEAADIQKLTNLSEDTVDYFMHRSNYIDRQIIDSFVEEIKNNFNFIDSICMYIDGLNAKKELEKKYHPFVCKFLIERMREFRGDPVQTSNNYLHRIRDCFNNIDENSFRRMLEFDKSYKPSSNSGYTLLDTDEYLEHIVDEDYETIYYAANCSVYLYNVNVECMKMLEEIGERGLKWHTQEEEGTHTK